MNWKGIEMVMLLVKERVLVMAIEKVIQLVMLRVTWWDCLMASLLARLWLVLKLENEWEMMMARLMEIELDSLLVKE